MAMSSSNKVGEIFGAAGEAFSQLGNLTIKLEGSQQVGGGAGAKWTNEEVDMVRQVVRTAEDLNLISETIKQRTVARISNALKKNAFEDAGITANLLQNQTQAGHGHLPSSSGDRSDVTLNAIKSEVDVEGLDFGSNQR